MALLFKWTIQESIQAARTSDGSERLTDTGSAHRINSVETPAVFHFENKKKSVIQKSS